MAGIKDLAVRVADELVVTQVTAQAAVYSVLGAIADIAAEGGTVTIRDYGTFKRKTTKARVGRNPQTGEPLQIPAKTKLTFKATTTK